MDSAVEKARQYAADDLSAMTAPWPDLQEIARALLSSHSQLERMREALEGFVSYHDRLSGMSVDELLVGDGTSETELVAKARAALTKEEKRP